MQTIVKSDLQLLKAHELYTTIKKADYITANHSLRVACLSKIFVREYIPDVDFLKAFISGLLHDIGKLEMPKIYFTDRILCEAEKEIIHMHPFHSKLILSRTGIFDDEIIIAVYQHHERADKSGYPNQLPLEKLSSLGKILAITDSFAAITEDRHYKKKKSTKEAVDILLGDSKLYDSQILITFTDNIQNILTKCNIKE